jgi:hypothetical protein
MVSRGSHWDCCGSDVDAIQPSEKPVSQYLAKYCVVNKDGTRQTEWTNPCFAKAKGQRVLHLGACQGPICPFIPFIYLPVCSLNPYTNKPETYANQCLSDVGNATLIHKGACK